MRIPGKQFRIRMAAALNHWLNVPFEKMVKIGEIIQLLHTGSLLIDDIQDGSVLRRGVPAAHQLFGIHCTMNTACYVITHALIQTNEVGGEAANRIFCHELLELHRGQGADIFWRDNAICPTEKEYKLMVVRKTGGLFLMLIRMLQLFSDNKRDFTKLAGLVGLFFQVRDDYCSLKSKDYTNKKAFCEDLSEGKMSFPVVHSIMAMNDREVLRMFYGVLEIFIINNFNLSSDMLRKRSTNIEDKKYCVELLEKNGSLRYTADMLELLEIEVRREINNLGGNPFMEKLVDELAAWKIMESN
nr:geranylgeranyl pyrophosphate synthase isoform X1 [Aedes albopictus]